MKVSVLILTYNEEDNLPSCLSALQWCDDIVVLDSGSQDETVEIARTHGARIITRKFDDFASQRNWGLENGAFVNDWILHLDADEITPTEFVDALSQLQPQPGIDAWNIPSKLIFKGRWIKHAGAYPTYQVRLGHRDRLRFVQVGHGQRENLDRRRISTFGVPYEHYSFSRGLSDWLQRHIRYARNEANLISSANPIATPLSRQGGASAGRRRMKAITAKIPASARPFARFFFHYVYKRGFLDGRAGFVYAFMMAVYEGMVAIFLLEKWMGEYQATSSPEIDDPK